MDTKEAILSAMTEMEWNDELSIRWEYSGRAMYGDTCIGIVADDVDFVIEDLKQRAIDEGADGYDVADMLSGARFDQMGLSEIAYWPSLTAEEGDVR